MRLAHLPASAKAFVLFLATGLVVACLAPLIGEPVEERSALWVVTDRALVRVGLDTDGTHRTTDPIPGAAAAEVRVRGNRLITARVDAITSHALTPSLQPGEGTTVAMDAAAVSGLAASADAERIWLARPLPHSAGDAGQGNKNHSNGSGHNAGPAGRITAFDQDLMPQWQRDLPGRVIALASALSNQDDIAVWALQPRQLVGLDEAGATVVSLPLPPGPPARAFVPLENQRFAVADVRGVRLFDAMGQLLAEQRLVDTRDLHPLTGDEPAGLLWAVSRHRLALLDAQLQPVRTWHLPAQALARPVVASTVDPRDGSLWFVSGDSLYNAGPDGALTEHRDLFAYLGTDPVTDLALYADTLAPELTVIEPAQPLVTNNDQPDLVLEYQDTGIGVDTDTLNVERDGEPVDGTCETDTEAQRIDCVIGPFDDDTHTITATVADYAGNESEPAEATYEIDTVAPEITIESPADGAYVNTEQVTISGQLSETAELTIDAEPAGLDIDNRFEQVITLDSDDTHSLELEAIDGAGNRTTRTLTVTRDTVAPPIVIADGVTVEAGDEKGNVRITGADGSAEPEAEVVITNTRTDDTIVVQANAQGAFTATIAGEVGDTYEIVVRDAAGNESEAEPVTGVDEDVPPDPADIAPPLPETGIPPFEDQISFLYEGDNAIQQDVAPGTIEAHRVSVLRGNVRNRAGEPIPGVQITILNHPELGHTATQVDGDFDMAVNGGGALTVEYQKEGYLPVQRTVSTQWNGWYHADDVVMIPLDDRVTTIDLTDDSQPFQVARGSIVTDADGTRQATVLFPAGTTAEITLPDGTKKQLSQLDVRATEYTVGNTGPAAMPGELPPTTAYTYAVELSVDQALEQGVKVQGKDVIFNQPVPVYVDNFLDFPIGGPVPIGYYNNDTAAWVPHENGRIVGILEEQGMLAVLDVTGDGNPATTEELHALNITDGERAQLAALYSPGDSVWRMMTTHLSTWDLNWLYAPPDDGTRPPLLETDDNLDDESSESDEEDPCDGCVISPQKRSLDESLAIAGAPFKLLYQSDAASGFKDSKPEVQVTGSSVPASLREVVVTVSVAGQVQRHEFPPEPGQTLEVTWDGRDAFGRVVSGDVEADVQVSYIYPCQYLSSPEDREASFSQWGFRTDQFEAIGTRDRCQGFEFSRSTTVSLGGNSSLYKNTSVGNWSLSIEHTLPAERDVIVEGDGNTRRIALEQMIATIAGTEASGDSGDDGPATDAALNGPRGLAVAGDGTVYIADTANHRVRMMRPDGVIVTVAGDGSSGYGGDGGPAVNAKLAEPRDVAVGPDGSVYIADSGNHRIRRIGPDGTIGTLAGTGENGFSGDGGPALEANLAEPSGIAFGPDNSIYVADTANNRVRRITTDGAISTVAGDGSLDLQDGVPAIETGLAGPLGVAVAPDGAFYIADTNHDRIRRVEKNGTIQTVAGGGGPPPFTGFIGDDGPADEAILDSPSDVVVAQGDTLVIANAAGMRVRFVDRFGTISTLAGTGTAGFSGDGGPAHEAELNSPNAVAVDPLGRVLVADEGNNRVRRIGRGDIQFTVDGEPMVVSDGSEMAFVFDPAGRHVRTVYTRTSEIAYEFLRDSAGRVISVVDGDGDETRLQRDAAGAVESIVSADGQTTLLDVDGNGHLTGMIDPLGNGWSMQYTTDGLLTRMQRPDNSVNEFVYDENGRLIEDRDPVGGGWTLSRAEQDDGFVTTMTSGEGREYRFETERNRYFRRYRKTAPDGTMTVRGHMDRGSGIRYPDGTVIQRTDAPDPRYGDSGQYDANRIVELPSGLTFNQQTARTAQGEFALDPLALDSLTEEITTNGRKSVVHYEADSRTLSLTSAAGRVTNIVTDGQNRPIQQSVAGIEPVHTEYDSRGRLVSVEQGTDDDLRSTTFDYHETGAQAGYLASVTDALDRTVSFETDALGRVTGQTLPDGRTIGYQYDGRGNLVAITPPDREAHVFQYDGLDQRLDYTPPDLAATDTITRYTYNLDRQIRRIDRPGGEVVTFDHDAGGRLSTRHMPVGDTVYGYQADTGQLQSIDAPGGVGLQFGWDGFLPVQSTWTGPVAGVVDREFDSNFWLTRERVNGNAINFEYDDDGLLTRAGDLTLGRSAGNGLIQSIDLAGTDEFRQHNPFGELDSVNLAGAMLDIDAPTATDAESITVTGSMPGADRLEINGEVIPVASDGIVSGEIALPNLGQNQLEILLFGEESPTKVLLERAVSVERVEPQAGTEFPVEQVFDTTADGSVYVRADDSGAYSGVWFIPAATGKPEKPSWSVAPDEVRVSPAGDVYLRLGTQIMDESGNPVADFGAIPDSSIEEFTVAVDGTIFARTGSNELYRTTDTGIERLGPNGGFGGLGGSIDIDSSAWGVGVISGSQVYQFDGACASSSGTFDCFTEWFSTGSFSFQIALALSDTGTACYIGSETVRCRQLDGTQRSAAFHGTEFELGPEDLLVYLSGSTLRRELSGGGSEPVVEQLPGSSGPGTAEMTVTGGVTDTDLYSVDYTRDKLGRITEKSETIEREAHTYQYEYDIAGRLVEVREDGTPIHLYSYDANGNRTGHTGPAGTRTGTYDAQDRVTEYGDASYTHTPAGERASKTTPQGATTYDYDAAGNLREATLPDGTEIEYLIDGQDRRIGKIVNGALQKGWLYRDQLNPVAQLDDDGNVTHRFVYGDKQNVPAYMVKDGTTYRIVSDHLGSVRLVIDTTSNEIVQRMDYSPFGEVIADTSPGFQPFGFAGGLYDRDTGLVRFGARDYDPEIGRWTAKDPIGFAGGTTNLFEYAINDPINYFDPNGQVVNLVTGLIGAGVGAAVAAATGQSIAAGAISGGLAGLFPGGGLLFNAAFGAGAGAFGAAADPCSSSTDIAVAAAAGAFGGAFGRQAGLTNGVTAARSGAANAVERAFRAEAAAGSFASGGATAAAAAAQ